MKESGQHLTDAVLQALLELELSEGATRAAKAHLAYCAECAQRLESCRTVLQALDQLSEFEPSPPFRDRVLTELSIRSGPAPGLMGRVRQALRRRTVVGRHLKPLGIRGLLDGTIGGEAHAYMLRHLGECASCKSEVAAWRELYQTLAGLQPLEPAPGFAQRVMARVGQGALRAQPRVPATSLPNRVIEAAKSLLPSSRRGWTVAGGMAAAPTVAVALAIAFVASNPLLTPMDLLAFVGWQVGDLLQAVGGWALQWVGGGSRALLDYGLVGTFVSSPSLAVAALGGLWATMAAAGWVLYRHVIAPTLPTRRHAKAS